MLELKYTIAGHIAHSEVIKFAWLSSEISSRLWEKNRLNPSHDSYYCFPSRPRQFFLCFCGCVCMMKSKETCAEKFCNEHNIFKSPNHHITSWANILHVLNTQIVPQLMILGTWLKYPKCTIQADFIQIINA